MAELNDIARGRVVVLGVGNYLNADDGAGSLVAKALKKRFPENVFDAEAVPENFIGPVCRARPDTVLIIDAADFEGEPGEVQIVSDEEIGGLAAGTHAAPLTLFMSAVSHECGAETHLVAIQAKTTEFGGSVSEEVTAAVDRLVSELAAVLERRDDQ